MKKNLQLLDEATRAWNNLAEFRRERERCKRYTYGRQWDDRITVDGQSLSEEDYIRSQGSVPLKNNMIRRLVRNVLGVWRNDFALPRPVAIDPGEQPLADVMASLLDANAQTNRLRELYARTMEEFLISGMAVHRKSFAPIRNRSDARTDYVHPDSFFFRSDSGDFRCWDFSLVGEIHDLPFRALVSSVVSDERHLEELMSLYNVESADSARSCRVFEIWHRRNVSRREWCDHDRGLLISSAEKKQAPPSGSAVRLSFSQEWICTFLGPGGEILWEGPTPYAHGGHPYVVRLYPYIDGEIHSFVSDVIDQQRYTNRLITLYDWIMRASAKGVLLFPEGSLPEGTELEDVAEEWSRFNGVIMFRPRAGTPLPQQVSSNATNIGITELLNIQLKMFEDISGVNSALQGKLESSSVSGTLFSQQTHNALTSLRDLLESFREFVIEGTMRDASNIAAFYSRKRARRIAGATRLDRIGALRDFEDAEIDFIFEKEEAGSYLEEEEEEPEKSLSSRSASSAASASAISQSRGVSRSTERSRGIS